MVDGWRLVVPLGIDEEIPCSLRDEKMAAVTPAPAAADTPAIMAIVALDIGWQGRDWYVPQRAPTSREIGKRSWMHLPNVLFD